MLQVSDVRIHRVDDRAVDDRLLAFATAVVGGGLLVRELRVVRVGARWVLAMPNRKPTERCHACHDKVTLTANYCPRCGVRLAFDRAALGGRGRGTRDICHPIDVTSRGAMERAVFSAYDDAARRSEVAR